MSRNTINKTTPIKIVTLIQPRDFAETRLSTALDFVLLFNLVECLSTRRILLSSANLNSKSSVVELNCEKFWHKQAQFASVTPEEK